MNDQTQRPTIWWIRAFSVGCGTFLGAFGGALAMLVLLICSVSGAGPSDKDDPFGKAILVLLGCGAMIGAGVGCWLGMWAVRREEHLKRNHLT